MTIKTFWTILLKILGLSLVLGGLKVVPKFLSALPFFGRNDGVHFQAFWYMLVLLLLSLALYALILWLFVFKTAWLIRLLHLEKGFEEERIDLNLRSSTVLSLAVIILGALLFIESFPLFCQQLIVYFQQLHLKHPTNHTGWIIFHLVKAIMGYLLMTRSRPLIKLIHKALGNQADEMKNI